MDKALESVVGSSAEHTTVDLDPEVEAAGVKDVMDEVRAHEELNTAAQAVGGQARGEHTRMSLSDSGRLAIIFSKLEQEKKEMKGELTNAA